MAKGDKYIPIHENEPFVLDQGQCIACCDCGLVHKVRFRLVNARQLELRMTRENRRTAGIRAAAKRKKGTR